MKYTDIKTKSDQELAELVQKERETLRAERFKDRMSRTASAISSSKRTIARALTELSDRRRNPSTN